MRRRAFMVVTGVVVILIAVALQTAVFSKGNSKTGSNNHESKYSRSLAGGSNTGDGWVAGEAGGDSTNDYLTEPDGDKSIDLAVIPYVPGSIRQAVDISPGKLSDVRFAMAGNPDDQARTSFEGLPGSDSGDGQGTGETTGYSNTTGSPGIGGTNLADGPFQFLASGGQTTLPPATNDPSDSINPTGSALDDGKATTVPEAGALFLFGSGLIGLVGYRRVRRMQ